MKFQFFKNTKWHKDCIFSNYSNIECSYSLNKSCTVFQAEVFGILKAAELMEGISNKDISIYADNQAAITAIGSNTIRSFTVKTAKNF